MVSSLNESIISIPIVSPLVGNDKGRVLQSIMRCWWRTRLMGWTLLVRRCQMVRWSQNQAFLCRMFCPGIEFWRFFCSNLRFLVWFSLRNVMTDCTIVQQQESWAWAGVCSRQQFPTKPLNVSTLWIVISLATPSVRFNSMERLS